jgi:hypothetical protein
MYVIHTQALQLQLPLLIPPFHVSHLPIIAFEHKYISEMELKDEEHVDMPRVCPETLTWSNKKTAEWGGFYYKQ